MITSTATRLLEQAARLGIHPDPTPDDEAATATDADSEADDAEPAADADDPGADGDVGLGDYLAWLAEDLDREAIGTGALGALGLVLNELRTHPEVVAVPANHGIHQAIRAADRLRATYADLA